MDERFPGELATLRADNVRLRRLLELSKEQARAADPDQPALTGAPTAPMDMRSAPEAKLRFYASLFRCRTDVYALRWENRRDGRAGWMPAINGYGHKGMSRADAPYLTLTAEVIAKHLRNLNGVVKPLWRVLVGSKRRFVRRAAGPRGRRCGGGRGISCSERAHRRSPPSSTAPPATGCNHDEVTAGGLPELDVTRAQRWCARQVPEHIRSEIRVECDIAARHLTICECRPPWREAFGPDWTRFPMARLRYTTTSTAEPIPFSGDKNQLHSSQ